MSKRELIVTADGTDRTVVIEGPLPGAVGKFRVAIDGNARDVNARELRPGTWSLVIDGRQFLVDLDRDRQPGAIGGSTGASEALLTVEDAMHRRLAQAASARAPKARGEAIRAPIAGKVVKLLVAVGDTVPAGTAVIVLEAMKMENELVSERGGTVKAVHKQAGQAAVVGELLVELA
jgi:glutaconyl-CoA/methylmalonyl-CoA decarboxylase subunit gamma